MVKTCWRLLLFQARRTSVLVQSPRFLLSCSVRGMSELVQCLSRPCRKPTCLDRPARGCTCVCGQTWTRRSRSFFLGRPTSSCHVEFSKSRCLGASEVEVFFFFVLYLFIFFYGYSTNNIQIETYEHYKIYNNYLNYKLQRKEEMKIKKLE